MSKTICQAAEPVEHLNARLAALFWLAIATLLLSGCANLRAVRDFAQTSTEGQTLQAVAAELAESPRRQIRYTTNQAVKTDLELSAAIGRTNRDEIVAAHQAIQAYMATLATLASDGIVASNNTMAQLNQALAESRFFAVHEKERDAFGKLAELVMTAATDFYRRAELRHMIKQAEPYFPVAIAALQRIVTNDCVMLLQGEMGAMNQYYELQSGLQNASTPAWAVVLVEEVRQERAATIEQKIRVCRQYGVILGKIGEGHAAMAQNVKHLDTKEVVATLEGYQQEISAAYESFKQVSW